MNRSTLENLVLLRSYAFFGVFLVLGTVWLSHAIELWPPSFLCLLIYGCSNLVLYRVSSKLSLSKKDGVVCAIAIFDVAYLSVLLYYNGAAHNPFSILFIAICSVSAMSLSRYYLWLVIACALFGLFVIYNGSPSMGPHAAHGMHRENTEFIFHLRGMWLANSIAVIVVSLFVYRLRVEHDAISKKHEETQRVLFHLERVESMGRLLASAAHQLNTPLATLQFGISELSNQTHPLNDQDRSLWLDDLQKAVTHISSILDTLKNSHADSQDVEAVCEWGDDTLTEDLSCYVEALVLRWGETRGIHISYCSELDAPPVSRVRLDELRSVIEAILENAYDATRADTPLEIAVRLSQVDQEIVLSVTDHGMGMDAVSLSRATEPLFTTKKKGTGLGLYICHQFAKRRGGRLVLRSTLGVGTEVILSLKVSEL